MKVKDMGWWLSVSEISLCFKSTLRLKSPALNLYQQGLCLNPQHLAPRGGAQSVFESKPFNDLI